MKYVHIHSYRAKIKKIYIKIPQGRCATPPNVPKISVFGVKNTTKTNKYLGMSCYIQVQYSVFFRW